MTVRRILILTAGIIMSAGTSADEIDGHSTAAKGNHGPAWDYSSQRGPEHWAELSPDYVLARIGGSQSPIDIRPSETIGADLPVLQVVPHEKPLHMINNGHTVEAICPGAATLHFGAHDYELLQFHFHAPSEHTVDGRHAAAELHFVHADGAGHLAVVAVMFFEGEVEHPEIAELLTRDSIAHAGDEIIEPSTPIDVRNFMPATLDYFTYDGSLTTPPATEGVRWFVLREPLHLTREQIEALDHVYYSNNRPTQPLNARLVLTRR